MRRLILITVSVFLIQVAKAQMILTNETIFSGFVGKYEIRMKLGVPYGGATSCFTLGEYYYTKNKGKIDLCGGSDGSIVESVNGKDVGYFVFNGPWNKNVGQTISGNWFSLVKNKSYPVVLKVIAKGKN